MKDSSCLMVQVLDRMETVYPKEIFINIMTGLTVSYNGLTYRQLADLIEPKNDMEDLYIQAILEDLDYFIIKYNDQYVFNLKIIEESVLERYKDRVTSVREKIVIIGRDDCNEFIYQLLALKELETIQEVFDSSWGYNLVMSGDRSLVGQGFQIYDLSKPVHALLNKMLDDAGDSEKPLLIEKFVEAIIAGGFTYRLKDLWMT